MGLLRKENVEDYLSKKNPSQSTPYFATVVPLRQFAMMQRYLHVGAMDEESRRIYLPKKRHSQFVTKEFELCDPISGDVLHVELHAGKDFHIRRDQSCYRFTDKSQSSKSSCRINSLLGTMYVLLGTRKHRMLLNK